MTGDLQMQAIEISRPGGPEVLRAHQTARPEPGPGDVLIRVAAAGVNFPDLLQRRGAYEPPPGHSPLPGLEVSGTIAALGQGTTGLRVGDAVVALCNGGGYAEYVAVPVGQVLPLPQGWSFAAGSSLPETVFTVTQTLVQRAGLAPGMALLVHGAAGGIGGAAIQIGTALGARAIAVVSSLEKAEYAKSLGAVAAIDHTREDFAEATLRLTEGNGADRILSIAGGDMLQRNIVAAACFGVIVQLASLGADRAEISTGMLLRKSLTLIGSVLRPQPSAAKAAIAAGVRDVVWPAIEAGRIRPPRLQALPLEAARTAHERLESRALIGKLVLLTRYGEALGAETAIAGR